MAEHPSRRAALSALTAGAVATGLPVAETRAGANEPAVNPPSREPPGACTLLPQAVEGPFYFDPKLVRADIAEDRPGAPVTLALRVIAVGSCAPLANARVEVWHADATGFYSGYDRQGERGDVSTKGATFLRGAQITDADGRVTFRTIYPGWYPGRTPHIHVKAFLDAKTLVTGQIYFPDDVSAKIYATREPYKARSGADTTNASDFIFREGQREGGGIVMAVAEEGADIVASLVIAVDQSGAATREGGGFGGFIRRMLGQ
ncbi:MAG: intradiol ring-cleavage dioxygenase [Hyphomicrobium sp.]